MTEKEVRLPTQRELEEHCSLMQAFIQNYDAELNSKTNDSKSDTQSISSYTCGPNDAREPSDDSVSSRNNTIKNGGPKAGQAYTSADNAFIWQAYSDAKTPESRHKALGKVALQLGRSYNGIVRHVRHLREQRLIASATAKIDASGSESESDDSSSSSISYISYVGDATSRAVQPMKAGQEARIVHGKGFIYTEEEDTDIWAAYLSTTNSNKRTKALRAVADRQGRKYTAVMSHLKKMLSAQTDRYFPMVEESHATDDTSNFRPKSKVVNQVSDVSESSSESEPVQRAAGVAPSAHATDNTDAVVHIGQPFSQSLATHSNAPANTNSHPTVTASTQSYFENNRYNVRATSFNGTPITFCGDTANALADYRATVPQAVYAPETVDDQQGLSSYVKSLRVSGLDMVFPVEAHDQVLCIALSCFLRAQRHVPTNPYYNIYNAITSARNVLQQTFFHLSGVSNRKLHGVLKLLHAAHCVTMGSVQGVVHMDPEIRSMAVLRRRHDRCLARRMRPEHRVHLENVLLWPLDAEAERMKITEMESVMVKVERVLDNLARQPKLAFLRS